jgi:hypothetical protein
MSENAGGEVAVARTSQPVTQTGEPFETQGRTRLATRRGYRFAPSDKDLPVITSSGVNVSASQAADIIAEADADTEGLVYKVQDEED